jgi:hypothetical protein
MAEIAGAQTNTHEQANAPKEAPSSRRRRRTLA